MFGQAGIGPLTPFEYTDKSQKVKKPQTADAVAHITGLGNSIYIEFMAIARTALENSFSILDSPGSALPVRASI